MSHRTQMRFVEIVSALNADLVSGASVVEIGSYDVNGSVRTVLSGAAEYLGVDLTPGPGVDVVALGHTLEMPPGSFDMAISCECFEHDPHWVETFTHMARLTRPGGLVVFTCAGRARPEHGTQRTAAVLSPGTQSLGIDYYRNLEAADVEAEVDLRQWFDEWIFGYQPDYCDLYFAGVRSADSGGSPGQEVAVLPTAEQIAGVREVAPLSLRIKGAALRTLRRTSSEAVYQDRLIAARRVLDAVIPSRRQVR